MAVKEAAPRYRRINLPSLDELFLGWTKGLDTSRNFCWRQLRDMKGPALVELAIRSGRLEAVEGV